MQPQATATKLLDNYIGGKWTPVDASNELDVTNPASGELLARVPLSSATDLDAAVKAARAALPAWRDVSVIQRARHLFALREGLEARREEMARSVTAEMGKTIADSRAEVGRMIEMVEAACAIPTTMQGRVIEDVSRGVDCETIRQPVGVCAGIAPFNFPAMVPFWFLPFAIGCGNAFILKPSEQVPMTQQIAFEVLDGLDLPPGVVNLVNGGREVVESILEHPDIDAVSFVGSAPVARLVYEGAARTGKRVQALGGAKNHLVVMPDADMDQTVDALMGSAYGSAGERCMAISVAVAVGDETADDLVARLKPRVASLKVGAYDQEGVEMGPLVTGAHRDKVKGYVDLGVEEGAALVVDGRGTTVADHEDGFFVGGCLFDKVTTDMRIYKEEIFGPVLSIVRAKDYEEALQMVNDHEFGNGAAIFTRDGDAARNFTSRVNIGMVGVNVPIPVPTAYYSFGGWKRSLFGDHNMHGPEGVRFFTRQKTITSRWPSGIREGADFSIPRTR